MTWHFRWACLLVMAAGAAVQADEPPVQTIDLKVPEGFAVELVAGPPLFDRPITAAFDDEGRLYVADSSGSNDPVEKQLAERPHRIVCLEDTDGDGKFDRHTVFADRMMFPSGTLFHAGSLYVSAPPSIWKLTDTDDDGVADERVEWFQGKTLTLCANDLHGPYLGPGGWIYWCKGAFAEQTYTIRGREWKSRAAHVFRCRPDGSDLEPVITGGMDNPVDVAFTAEGESIFTATFLVHPGEGHRDGLIHAIYGGVYGKDHGVLEGHPRTGELMPVLTHLGPAAPSGLHRYESSVFGDEYRDNLFACQFNLRRVSRHVLRPASSSFVTDDSDFVTSDSVDFHPTDVLEDADGSLLVVNTGGWYKLCCPTSQLWKPDVLGGIYRIRKLDAKPPADPRGKQIPWNQLDIAQLWELFGDGRPAVRQRATREFAAHGKNDAIAVDQRSSPATPRLDFKTLTPAHVWALAQADTENSQGVIRRLLQHSNEQIRQAALHVVSLHRDAQAVPQLVEVLQHGSAANRRVAAEALGRIGDRSTVPHLLSAAPKAQDRAGQHAIIFALIQLADPIATRAGLTADQPETLQAALLALDQMPGGGIEPSAVIPLLNSENNDLRQAASWLVARHPEWGEALVIWFRAQLAALPEEPAAANPVHPNTLLETLLIKFSTDSHVQELLASCLTKPNHSSAARRMALQAMSQAKLDKPPTEWPEALAQVIEESDPTLLPLAIAAAMHFQQAESALPQLNKTLGVVADNVRLSLSIRIQALAATGNTSEPLPDSRYQLLLSALIAEQPLPLRLSAAEAISKSNLTNRQLDRLCDAIPSVGPLELHRLLEPFERTTDEPLGLKLVSSLKQSMSLPSLRINELRERLAEHGPAVRQQIDELHALVNVDLASQKQRIAELLPQMENGDVRRGHAVFHSAKATCTACHRMGYTGGSVGPDLTRIGETRTAQDLLEAILYPSLSFVRSFESVDIITTDGKPLNGLIRNETATEIILATGPNQETRIRRDEIDELRPSTISVMPAGLDKQLSVQELADLVAFLKHAK